MATINEFADQFSERIRNSVSRDGFTKTSPGTELQLRSSFTVREIIRLAVEMASFTVEKLGEHERAIGDDEKNEIIDQTAQRLGLRDREILRRVFREAGNPNNVTLTSSLSQLVAEIKK
jgi:hypothetical protein